MNYTHTIHIKNNTMEVLKELFASKKFVATITGIIVTLVGKLGFDLDETTITQLLGFVAVYLGSQAAADFGKEAKKLEQNK